MDIREQLRVLLGLKKLPEGENFEGFSDEQLTEAVEKVSSVFSKAKDEDDIDTAEEAAAIALALDAEIKDRATKAADKAARFAALEAQLNPSTETPEETPAETPAEETPETPAAPEGETVQAGATETPAPKPVVPKPSNPPAAETPVLRIVASADIEDHSPGTYMSAHELGAAFAAKGRAVIGGKIGGRSPVAKIQVSYPENRQLSDRVSSDVNMERINEVVAAAQEETRQTLRNMVKAGRDQDQITELAAAGGLCAPVNVRYDICQQGDDVRPLRDSLVRFAATRGGIRFITPPQLSDVDGSVNVYTEAQDTTGYDYPKGCIRVDCGDEVEVKVQAISLCMEVGNFQKLSYPENFDAWWRYGQIAYARTAETEIWDRMVALSTARTANTSGVGAFRNTLNELERYVAQFRYKFRIAPEAPLRIWAPEWLETVLRTDLANQHPGDNTLSVSDAQLAQYLAARGVAVTWVLDGQTPNDGDTALPTTVDVIMALEGTFLFLDMGQLDFGTEIRDFSQIRQNDVGAFMETFENVAAVCNGPQVITFPICPTGLAAASDVTITC